MRAKLFHRAYPNKTITPSMLQHLYRRCNVSRKVVRHCKALQPTGLPDFAELKADLIAQMDQATSKGKLIIYLDETIFTSKTVQTREYSCKGQNITIDRSRLNNAYYSAIAAISDRGKVEHVYLHDGAINMWHFNAFLKQLRRKLGDDEVFLFMDQLQVHKGKDVLPMYSKLNFVPIWNIKYSPDYNPIETVFAQVKLWYKRERLHLVATEQVSNRYLMKAGSGCKRDRAMNGMRMYSLGSERVRDA